MVLEVNSMTPVSGVQSNYTINPLRKGLVLQNYATPPSKPDSVNTNTDLSKYLNEKAISEMITASSEIKQILKAAKIPAKVNMTILNELVANHLPQTKNVSVGIASNLPQNLKAGVNVQSLQKAAVLHDIGKVLIPNEIVNKKGKLTDSERDIMQKHSILGYELLKTTDIDQDTLYLVRNHHQNAQKTGYPAVDDNFVADINLQILSVADMYSALREKRSYKPAMSKNQALAIIHKDMKQGKVHPYVFKALVDYANKEEERLTNVEPQRQVFYLKPEYSLSA